MYCKAIKILTLLALQQTVVPEQTDDPPVRKTSQQTIIEPWRGSKDKSLEGLEIGSLKRATG